MGGSGAGGSEDAPCAPIELNEMLGVASSCANVPRAWDLVSPSQRRVVHHHPIISRVVESSRGGRGTPASRQVQSGSHWRYGHGSMRIPAIVITRID